MTEAEWLKCVHPDWMVDFLLGKATERKMRLLMIAACRRVQHLLDKHYLASLEAGERLADGMLDSNSFARYRSKCRRVSPRVLSNEENRWRLDSRRFNGTELAKQAAWLSGSNEENRVRDCLSLAARGASPLHSSHEEAWYQFNIIHDIFGNPFSPVTLDPSWLTSTVLALANGTYDEKAFDRMPILADALQDAGCDNPEILDHCRQSGEHVRGCWLVDLLIGRT